MKFKKCRVLSLIDSAGAEIIPADKMHSCKKMTFFNMNSKDDFEKVKHIARTDRLPHKTR